jgi:hypothetical protein
VRQRRLPRRSHLVSRRRERRERDQNRNRDRESSRLLSKAIFTKVRLVINDDRTINFFSPPRHRPALPRKKSSLASRRSLSCHIKRRSKRARSSLGMFLPHSCPRARVQTFLHRWRQNSQRLSTLKVSMSRSKLKVETFLPSSSAPGGTVTCVFIQCRREAKEKA